MKWAKLGDVCEIRNGYTPLKSKPEYWSNGHIPWVKIEDMRAQGADLHAAGNLVTPAAIKGKLLEPGTLLLSTTATIGVQSIVRIPCICNQQISAIRPKSSEIDTKFLLYFIGTQQHELLRLANHSGTVSILNNEGLRKLQIPIPPLDEQARIVGVLDRLEAVSGRLINVLEQELSLRTKQYNYYREQLLSASNLSSCSWHTLGDIGEFIRGNGLQKRDFTPSGNPVVHYGQIYTRYGFSASKTVAFTSDEIYRKLRKAQPGDILMATTSENFEYLGKCVVWEGSGEVGISGDMMLYRTAQNPRYLAHWFASEQFRAQKLKVANGVKVLRINQEDMKHFKIPIPPLNEQSRIVGVLDNYTNLKDALVSKISAEIKERTKQARFYKEQLLSFDKS